MAQSSAVTVEETEGFRAKPFLKWAGGKRQLLPELLARVPKTFGTYYEPFLGGGALFFALQPERAVVSDYVEELINVYTVVRNKTDELIADLRTHVHSKEYYYAIRNIDRTPEYAAWSDVSRASRFIFLNRTCFNGLYRVNSNGQFNTPFGDYAAPTIVDEPNLRATSEVLQRAVVHRSSFDRAVKHAKANDFVYFDPPYIPLNATSSFTSYSDNGFSLSHHKKLRDTCRSLDARGVKFMLSNSYTDVTLGLFDEFCVTPVQASRAINSKADKRGKVYEIIVTNYS